MFSSERITEVIPQNLIESGKLCRQSIGSNWRIVQNAYPCEVL